MDEARSGVTSDSDYTLAMLVRMLTWGTGDCGTALVLGLLHNTVLSNRFDEGADPGEGVVHCLIKKK